MARFGIHPPWDTKPPLGLVGLAPRFEDCTESNFRWLIGLSYEIGIFIFKVVSQDFQGASRSGAFFFFSSDQMRI